MSSSSALAVVFLIISAAWVSAMPVTIQPIADGFVRSGSPTTSVNSSALMELAARNGPWDRKIYLKYNLTGLLADGREASNARLSLALASQGTRLLGTEAGQVELALYGIADNDDAWAENVVTWNNAPHNDTASGTLLTPGAVLLAKVKVDSSRVNSLDRITWSSHELAQYLNWAVGLRGQRYVTGQGSDSDRKVTFVITVSNVGTSVPGFILQRRQAGADVAPLLQFDDLPPVASDNSLQNDHFSVTLGGDHSVVVREKASGAEARFTPRFQVIRRTSSPGFSTAALTGTPQGASTTNLNYTVVSWTGSGGDFSLAPGTRSDLTASASQTVYNGVNWTFPAGNGITFKASLELPPDDGGPLVRWTLTPTALSYFSVGYIGAPTAAFDEVDSIFQPPIWSGKRFPVKMYLTDESRCSLPVSFIQQDGVVTGVAVDPAFLSFRISTLSNSRYGVSVREAPNQLQPAVFAPLYGGSGSNRSTEHNFGVRLIVRRGNVTQVFRQLATGLYEFHDQRQNLSGGSLNATLDNLTDFLLNTTGNNYSYWSVAAKANDYVNDQPGYARFQSAVSTLGLSLIRDDAAMYADRAVPTIEYFASKKRNLFKITGYDATYPMGGPVSGITGDWAALGSQTGGRFRAWEPLGVAATYSTISLTDRVDHTATYDRATTLDLAKRWLRPLTAYYRATGEAAYRADATAIADQYIAWRINQPPVDFRDVFSSFWTEIAPIWDALFELYEATGEDRYRDAAVKALDEFIILMQFGPVSPPGTVTVSSSAIPAWQVSEAGLYSEAAGTSNSHRAILMPYVAPYLVRAAQLTGDPFYATLAKANIVGRYLNYPGYTVKDSYDTTIQSASYPLRWYSSYVNTAHMNHPSPMAAMIVDYLMADAERGSEGNVRFPSLFTDTGAYFKQRVYGQAPGSFYGDQDVWPWLPRKLITFTGANANQINYVTGRGNGRLYVHLSNQCPSDTTVTLQIDPTRANWTPEARVRVWRGDSALPDSVLAAGSLIVTIPGDGFLALAIDDVTPVVALQSELANSGPRLPGSSYYSGTAAFGSNVGFVFSLSPAQQRAFVYTDAPPSPLGSATLRYTIDNGAEQILTKSVYPFEFSVPLPPTAASFTYRIEGGNGQVSELVTLSLVSGVVPVVPADFRLESAGENAADVLWTASAGAEAYRIERRSPGGMDFIALPEVTPGEEDHFSDVDLAGNSTYIYRMKALSDAGDSPWTAEAAVRTDSTFEGWSRSFFGTRDGTGAASALGDADGDGYPNLVEYALGTSPLLSGDWIRLIETTLRFPHVIRPDVTSRLMVTEDFATWQDAAVALPGQPFEVQLSGYSLALTEGSPGWLTLTPPASKPRLFFKLLTRVTADP